MNKALLPYFAKKTPGLTRAISRQGIKLRKNSPHIFFVGGVVGTVASTVMACRATLHLPETLGEIQTDLDALKEIKRDNENPSYPVKSSDEEFAKDAAYVYLKSVGKIGRLYGPSLAVGVVSISALTGAHVQLSRRNTALMAAYTTLQAAYENYRSRVEDEFGHDKELDLYHAKVGEEQVEGSDEMTPILDASKGSPYARWFEEGNQHWLRNAEYNRLFIEAQQNWANDRLQAKGHLFLNEVYDFLGFDRTPEGAVVGWVVGDNASDLADGYVDFGIYSRSDALNIEFINGYDPRVLLDFNVDGVIYKLI